MPPQEHTYLRTHELSGAALSISLADETRVLQTRAAASSAGRAAKTLVKDGPLRLTLVALRRGSSLKDHATEGAVSIQLLHGRAEVTAAGRQIALRPGGIAVLEPGVRHGARAGSDCALLVTVAMPDG
jgi:quercetin dioxygenase-like cupin family protein